MPKRTSRSLANSTRVIKQRLQYLCTVLFDGKYSRFAEAVGHTDLTSFKLVIYGNTAVTPAFLSNIIQHGVVNAEFLMCGTGPVCGLRPDGARAQLEIANCLDNSTPCFETRSVQFSELVHSRLPKAQAVEPGLVKTMYPAARAVHTARAADKPVLLYLAEPYVLAGASPLVAEMLRKKYITALVCTLGAVYRDLEWTYFGGCAYADGFQQDLAELNDAAYLATAQGLGYGEAVGRWCYADSARRTRSALATAYDLRAPLFVHATLGDSLTHWFPARRNAELGAAVGAAAYTDLLLFTEYLRRCAGSPGGTLLATDADGTALFRRACAAIASDRDATPVDDVATHLLYPPVISGELWRTFPALLTACDAVYDGSADDAR